MYFDGIFEIFCFTNLILGIINVLSSTSRVTKVEKMEIDSIIIER